MESVVKILDITEVTHNVKRFLVEKPSGYLFTPGQAVELAINKDGFRDKHNPFTFTSLPQWENLEFTIKGYPVSQYPNHKGVTEELHKLKVGDELILRESFGTIHYKKEGIFIAGGAGITPFISIFRQLKTEGKVGNNKLVFSNKTHGDIIYEEELRKIFPTGNLILVLTQEKLQDYEYGRINENLLRKHVNDFSKNFYLCGPWKMVESMQEILGKLGANQESIVFEE
ncbi:MAG: Oxidoreductase FAD/NAD(P)-binding domain protein [Candidatus Woesebacteria bacterium GW2011_GWA1_37_8]|uniref:Oxidoreductase FAD/NAD(P)-binding domain protein n=2 Tax=Candidatus Woeseibacteriota TaxID=1752722 RepID=A0A0G0NPL2_9BACT|nr:MAG: Oxidoreductase FAD/NAD(P)-binding domain protein [Microgenomates group bacterium GW2011_GWC1_37_12b]KKQ44954.1 MAG: Oxidoreductase FAD/NAD(P)-binding domain protein [Candidatus Woesebacteria bacterium GW2011_GWA1_37_8]KKQ87829.1 MAG: Oxidoreductase FAD/NAD(P)-binding domain protein [Candidatus Woesebacteria bacterium GW2011_GWB1_38_8b]